MFQIISIQIYWYVVYFVLIAKLFIVNYYKNIVANRTANNDLFWDFNKKLIELLHYFTK